MRKFQKSDFLLNEEAYSRLLKRESNIPTVCSAVPYGSYRVESSLRRPCRPVCPRPPRPQPIPPYPPCPPQPPQPTPCMPQQWCVCAPLPLCALPFMCCFPCCGQCPFQPPRPPR